MEYLCPICGSRETVEGEKQPDFCSNCRRDPEFIRRTLEGTPCVRPHCQNEQRMSGQLRGGNGTPEFMCTVCDFSTNDASVALAIITEHVRAQGLSGTQARHECYRRWQAFNTGRLSEDDRRLLRLPGVCSAGHPTAPPIGRPREDRANLRHGDEGRLGPSPVPRKK